MNFYLAVFKVRPCAVTTTSEEPLSAVYRHCLLHLDPRRKRIEKIILSSHAYQPQPTVSYVSLLISHSAIIQQRLLGRLYRHRTHRASTCDIYIHHVWHTLRPLLRISDSIPATPRLHTWSRRPRFPWSRYRNYPRHRFAVISESNLLENLRPKPNWSGTPRSVRLSCVFLKVG